MLTVNFGSRTPVYQQLYDDVVRLASLGVLKSNTKLPPVRVLASELGINPNTVSKAYKMLEAEKIEAKQELKAALKKAYKNGITKEEIDEMINQVINGGNQE